MNQVFSNEIHLLAEVQELLVQGMEPGEADDWIFRTKQHDRAVGLLTNDLVPRQTLYEQALIFALIPFLNCRLHLRNVVR